MSKWKYNLDFATCVYSGISDRIELEIRNGTKDRTEVLQELVDRYADEYMVSSKYLYDLLEQYKEKWNKN